MSPIEDFNEYKTRYFEEFPYTPPPPHIWDDAPKVDSKREGDDEGDGEKQGGYRRVSEEELHFRSPPPDKPKKKRTKGGAFSKWGARKKEDIGAEEITEEVSSERTEHTEL